MSKIKVYLIIKMIVNIKVNIELKEEREEQLNIIDFYYFVDLFLLFFFRSLLINFFIFFPFFKDFNPNIFILIEFYL